VHVGQKHQQKWAKHEICVKMPSILAWRLGIGLNPLPEPPKVPGVLVRFSGQLKIAQAFKPG
jgi:hypothetical protein